MPWQLRVIDGPDQGRSHFLGDGGVTTVGSSRKHADFSLNDLYAARVHCDIEIDGARIVVTPHDTPTGTLVNGQKVGLQQEVKHGDVIRVGNSHLRVEDVATAEQEAAAEEALPELEVEVLEEEAGAETAVAAAAGTDDEVLLVPTPAHALPGSRLDELAGHTLANFQVGKPIATGHSSMLFRARDLRNNAAVALKVLSTDFPSAENAEKEMQRFVQVSKAILNLRHDHLVPIWGVGKTGPYSWIAYELVEHTPLAELITRAGRGRGNWQTAHQIAVQMASVLAWVHEQRLVHANITAKHILWQPEVEIAKLADLGLSAALQGSVLQRTIWRDKIQEELFYLPPEQTQPNCFITGVCDIYSLGVVVYAVLTGRFPCVGGNQAETVRAIRETPPAPPSRFQPATPGEFEGIVLKMLAKKQEDRYQTADELCEDLQTVDAGEPAA